MDKIKFILILIKLTFKSTEGHSRKHIGGGRRALTLCCNPALTVKSLMNTLVGEADHWMKSSSCFEGSGCHGNSSF